MPEFNDQPRTVADTMAVINDFTHGGDRLVTSVVAVIEYIDGDDGQPSIVTIRDIGSTPIWRHMGMAKLLEADLELTFYRIQNPGDDEDAS